ncbi:MAG: DUF2019 domain-containing protein [Azospirillaceae bacterium]|nr:DUF2019 domain-containing protein [Azospirillaceae bacterium]
MKKKDLKNVTMDRLVEMFEEIGIAQYEALWDYNTTKFNWLYARMDAIAQELRRRGLEARRALMRLYDHPNVQVRLKAAQRSYGAAPVEARDCLEGIAETEMYPQAADARLSIGNLDEGTSLLT